MDYQTPNNTILRGTGLPILERSMIVNQKRRNLRKSFTWGTINFGLLSLLLFDLSQTCPLYLSYYHYLEYILILILTINILYYLYKIIKSSLVRSEPIAITLEQKKLLGIKDSDPSYRIIETSIKSTTDDSPVTSYSSTPMNLSALSWKSNISQNESMNYSMSSSWNYLKGTPDVNVSKFSNKTSPKSFSKQPSPAKLSFRDTSSLEFIKDENSLQKYLKEHEESQKVDKVTNKTHQSSNLLSSFWSHPVSKTAKDMSSFLKKCQYQLSTPSPTRTATSSPSSKVEDKTSSPAQVTALEVWTRINVDSVALTQWNENLRKWISQTILERLVEEFDRINDSLEKHGLTDIKIGRVGLDRLRKTAQMVPIAQFIPSLATLIPFLEVTTNQEYLEKRIRELARGGCMSEFKWNGGSSYNGKDWDDSLPTDCAVVMHLLASYLDTQLMPLPNMPDTKPFSGHHYIKATDKMPPLAPNSLFIQQVSEKPPHYRVVVGEKVYEMVKGYNNLFHSILFFIYHVNKMEHGMLGRVNLGRAGVNILWVIDQ
ncbi:transmembrane protein 209 [Anoplophora glabripennis]|nr:transmembrane protein 209 [Anoplophora glabripennis]